jgi:hypothetical protein
VFTYQQQPRTLHLESGTIPSFPAKAAIELTLAPDRVFGESAGDTGFLLAERDLKATWNGLTGRVVAVQTPPLTPVAFRATYFDGELILNGSSLWTTRELGSLEDGAEELESLRLLVPAILAVFLPRPVVVTAAKIRVGNAVLNSQLRRMGTPLEYTTQDGFAERLKHSLFALGAVMDGQSDAILAACSYLHVAQRLAQVGASPTEFVPEIILNLAKALEALFGSRDAMRSSLTTLGYDEAEREGIFVPLLLLRNEMDVGHAKLSSYPPDVIDRVHAFVDDAPLAIKELIVRVINAAIEKRWQARSGDSEVKTVDLVRVLESIRNGSAARGARVGNRPYLVFRFGHANGVRSACHLTNAATDKESMESHAAPPRALIGPPCS